MPLSAEDKIILPLDKCPVWMYAYIIEYMRIYVFPSGRCICLAARVIVHAYFMSREAKYSGIFFL